MSSFHISWIVAALFLVGLAAAFAKGATPKLSLWGILIDSRGRCSLTHFQTVVWTLLILSSLIAVLVTNGFDFSAIQVSPELFGLMGIAAGSAVLSSGVKGIKDEKGNVARAGKFRDSEGRERQRTARFPQIWLEEEGELADQVINITKYQNFVFTLVVAAFYCAVTWKQTALPTLNESVIWLLGISHAGYVGGKVPDKK